MSGSDQDMRGAIDFDPLEMITSFAKLVEPEEAFSEVLRLTTKWFDADCGQLIFTNLQTGKPEVRAASSTFTDSDLNFSTTILNDVLRRDRPLCIPDAKKHEFYRSADSVLSTGAKVISVIVVPLHDRTGKPIGALYLQRLSDLNGCFNESYDLERLANLTDALAPILTDQQQKQLIEHIVRDRTKALVTEMGFTVGGSRLMDREVYDLLERFAQSDLTVCIQGETGSGKELVAQAIHRLSPRAGKPFVMLPCNAISEGLAESEFFGHVKGSFAQAFNDKPGQFEMADGGTIFLDEVAKLSLDVQAKLLHVLEKGHSDRTTFYRVGGVKKISVDVRVVAATNMDLKQLVADRLFREDLYYRLNQLPLSVPPLRERRDDIVPLACAFLDRAGQRHGRACSLSRETEQALLEYDWPGNVRELRNRLERAVLLHEDTGLLAAREILGDQPAADGLPLADVEQVLLQTPFRDLSRAQKQRVVSAAVARYGNIRKAARELGISHQTIYNYLDQPASDAPPSG